MSNLHNAEAKEITLEQLEAVAGGVTGSADVDAKVTVDKGHVTTTITAHIGIQWRDGNKKPETNPGTER